MPVCCRQNVRPPRPERPAMQRAALALAKSERKNPREIAVQIAAELEQDRDFAKVSVDGPGFINLSLDNAFIAELMDKIGADKRLGCPQTENPKNIVIDSGGPNVAKSMHIGHLRRRLSARQSAGLKSLSDIRSFLTFISAIGEPRWA